MRGSDERSGSLFSYVDLEARVRRSHPLRLIREIANAALADLSGDFAALYRPKLGRLSVPPEPLLRARRVTPHVAVDGHLSKTGKPRKSAVGARTTHHPGYAVSQRCRKRIEEVFGWLKGSAGLAKVKLRGRARVETVFTLALAAYNLIRLPKLLGAAA